MHYRSCIFLTTLVGLDAAVCRFTTRRIPHAWLPLVCWVGLPLPPPPAVLVLIQRSLVAGWVVWWWVVMRLHTFVHDVTQLLCGGTVYTHSFVPHPPFTTRVPFRRCLLPHTPHLPPGVVYSPGRLPIVGGAPPPPTALRRGLTLGWWNICHLPSHSQPFCCTVICALWVCSAGVPTTHVFHLPLCCTTLQHLRNARCLRHFVARLTTTPRIRIYYHATCAFTFPFTYHALPHHDSAYHTHPQNATHSARARLNAVYTGALRTFPRSPLLAALFASTFRARLRLRHARLVGWFTVPATLAFRT